MVLEQITLEGSAWEIATTSPANQRWENFDALDGRAAWFYEALTNGPAMNSQKSGWGQKYLASYLDSDKDWIDGAQNYKLHIPFKGELKKVVITLTD